MEMRKLASALLGSPLYHSVMRWRMLQYRIGLRQSSLRWPWARPDAPYRAIVHGMDPMLWPAFDAAYPEYEKAFAGPDIHPAELRSQLRNPSVALIVFEGVSLRAIQRMTVGLQTPVFHASASPIPMLERDNSRASGFLLDTIGPWQASVRDTEVGLYLQFLDLEAREGLVEEARSLLARSPQPASGPGRVVMDILGASNAAEGPGTKSFCDHLLLPWYDPRVVDCLLGALVGASEVETDAHPLGLMAMLLGRRVKVRGNPFWAGLGLTEDVRQSRPRRRLTQAQLLAVIVLVMSRYVDPEGRLVDPSDGWHLPTARRDGAAL